VGNPLFKGKDLSLHRFGGIGNAGACGSDVRRKDGRLAEGAGGLVVHRGGERLVTGLEGEAGHRACLVGQLRPSRRTSGQAGGQRKGKQEQAEKAAGCHRLKVSDPPGEFKDLG
jgi:hypothetical protein